MIDSTEHSTEFSTVEEMERERKRRKVSREKSSEHETVPGPLMCLQPSSRIKPKASLSAHRDAFLKPSGKHQIYNGKTVDKTSSFGSIEVAPWLVVSLAAMEVKRPTAIQRACIPEILAGKDVIGSSKTGSGKTIAFVVPILQKLAENPCGTFGLVLTPTRELALQIYEQFTAISYRFELKAALITGGADWIDQTRALKGKPHIVIATPGRLADHIRSSGADTMIGLKRVRVLVLDEADRLLAEESGMMPDVDTCLDALPASENRQTCLFTATMTKEVLALKDIPRKKGQQPVSVCEMGGAMAVPMPLRLTYLMVPVQYRDAYLHELLETPHNKNQRAAVVFANKTSTVDVLERLLRGLGHGVTSLHSRLPQVERTSNLAKFRAGAVRILVATDVASRGLDIPAVDLVVNYDVPSSPDDFVHRVGRTARAGRTGEAVTLIGPRDPDRVRSIEKRVGRELTEFEESGVNIETRVVRDSLKLVGEIKREVLVAIDEGRDVRGNRITGKVRRLA